MAFLARREAFAGRVDSYKQINDLGEFARDLNRLNLITVESGPTLGKMSSYVRPVVILAFTARELQLNVESVALESAGPANHENCLKPLFPVDHVINQASVLLALVEEDARDRVPRDNGLNQAGAIPW